jgi:tetratricopeptide (TPR) repeat protein
LGRHDSALKLIQGGIGAVDRGGNQGLRVRARMVLARALVRAGKIQEAQQALDEVATIRTAIGSPDQAGRIDAARWRSEAYLAEQRFDAAAQQAHEALQLLGYPEKRRGPGLPHVLLTLSRVELARGRPVAALDAARSAVELFESDALDPEQSADVGEALLALAGAEREAHDDGAAEKAVQRAIPALRNGLGPEHSLVRQAEQLALDL